jgi:hypothetical protein
MLAENSRLGVISTPGDDARFHRKLFGLYLTCASAINPPLEDNGIWRATIELSQALPVVASQGTQS